MNTSLFRSGFFGLRTHLKRQELLMQAAKAQVLQADLVQRSLHQLAEYNEESQGDFVKPLLVGKAAQSSWSSLTGGVSVEEVEDLEKARTTIDNYEKIYSIYEHSSDLNHVMNVLKTRVDAHNPTIPLNVYRISPSISVDNLWVEIESCMQAYYDLIDECEEYPEWKKKVTFDLGNTMSYLALVVDESSRDDMVRDSPVYARFDAEKQIYFK